MSKDNEVCLVWLEGVLGWLRAEGQTKVVGYLEAVLEEVVLEVDLRKEEVEVDHRIKYGAAGPLWELPGQAPPAREED